MTVARARRTDRVADRRNLVDLLERGSRRFSPTQRRVAEYVLANYHDAAFMGVAELARMASVSPSAIVRFATSLRFRGYPDFQRALHGIVRSELRQGARLAAALDGDRRELLAERILGRELDNLAGLRAHLDRAAFRRAVEQVAAARTVDVIGFRASSALAHYLWYNLRKVKPDVRLYATPGSVTLDDLALSDRGALVVLVTFPRYSRELLDVAAFVRRAGFPSIGITNNELSPLVPLCRLALLVEVRELSFTDFHAAPIALLNALVAEVAQRLRHRALRRLDRLDDLAVERGYLYPGGRTGSRR